MADEKRRLLIDWNQIKTYRFFKFPKEMKQSDINSKTYIIRTGMLGYKIVGQVNQISEFHKDLQSLAESAEYLLFSPFEKILYGGLPNQNWFDEKPFGRFYLREF